MNEADIRKIAELAAGINRRRYRPKKLEFSKKLMIFVSILAAATWIVAAVSWFMWRDFPQDLVQYMTWFYGAAVTFYMCKSGYENREKIKRGGGDEL